MPCLLTEVGKFPTLTVWNARHLGSLFFPIFDKNDADYFLAIDLQIVSIKKMKLFG